MRQRRVFPTVVGVAAALLFSAAVGQDARRDGSPQNSPEWKRYQARLDQLRRRPPPDELVVTTRSSFRIRRMHLWLKAGPPEAAGQTRRRLTAYLEDTAGNRIQTVPDRVIFEAEPPARLDVSGEQRLRDGEASAVLTYAPGQQTARVRVHLPEYFLAPRLSVDLPAARSLNPLVFDETNQGAQRLPNVDAIVDGLLRGAQGLAADGRRLHAQGQAFTAGRVALEADDEGRALEAFRRGVEEYDSPLCAWGEVMLLRRLGRRAEAADRARELARDHPRTVVAQFAVERAGELWSVPFGWLFAPDPDDARR